ASALIWWRQEYQLSGKPWHSKTRGPSPSSTTFRLMPLALTIRSIGLLMFLVPPKPDTPSTRLARIHREPHGRNRGCRPSCKVSTSAGIGNGRIHTYWAGCLPHVTRLRVDTAVLPVRR